MTQQSKRAAVLKSADSESLMVAAKGQAAYSCLTRRPMLRIASFLRSSCVNFRRSSQFTSTICSSYKARQSYYSCGLCSALPSHFSWTAQSSELKRNVTTSATAELIPSSANLKDYDAQQIQVTCLLMQEPLQYLHAALDTA